ncbi:MAG: long-chain fatty acid--CoA ligase [Proteobacteria bacterium]|nr:long-chain fatty acid--CoA ligase [Pseudomonadota bacterium]
MVDQDWPSVIHMFLAQAERLASKPFLLAKRGGVLTAISWSETAEQVATLAAALKGLGVEPGDRVVIVSENRPEWCIADLAIMAAGGITVPAYTSNTERDHSHILEHSGARGAIISTAALARKFLPAAHRSDALEFVIAMEAPKLSQSLNLDIHLWDEVMACQDGDGEADGGDGGKGDVTALSESTRHFARDDVACIIYTSGTGGAPKGVMLSHGGLLHNCAGAAEVLAELGISNERFLSVIPLSHAYEHTAGQFLPIYLGASIAYAESLDRLGANFKEMKPSVMVIAPRLFEVLRTKITRAVEKQGGMKLKLFNRAIALGIKRFEDPGSLSLRERAENIFLERVVRTKVRAQLGGRLKALVSGGAPLNPDVGLFYAALGIRLLQGYGQTESSPVIAVNRPSRIKMDTVGPPLRNTEVRIAEDGEILVRGALVMKGYWRDEEATRAALQDGWLHTGDIGILDEDGHLKITDRKKDIIVFDKGDNVSPQRIEGMLTLEPELAQAMVYGDQHPHLVGLLVPDAEWLAGWAQKRGKDGGLEALAGDADLKAALDQAVSRVNKRLSNLERVRRFAVAPEAFTIENAQMTPTLKIRRHIISAVYKDVIEGLY